MVHAHCSFPAFSFQSLAHAPGLAAADRLSYGSHPGSRQVRTPGEGGSLPRPLVVASAAVGLQAAGPTWAPAPSSPGIRRAPLRSEATLPAGGSRWLPCPAGWSQVASASSLPLTAASPLPAGFLPSRVFLLGRGGHSFAAVVGMVPFGSGCISRTHSFPSQPQACPGSITPSPFFLLWLGRGHC